MGAESVTIPSVLIGTLNGTTQTREFTKDGAHAMYRIIGADGQQYGPVSADQMRQWIAEGRINAQTMALRAGDTQWQPVSAFPELVNASPHAQHNVETSKPAVQKFNIFAILGLVAGCISFVGSPASFCCFCIGILSPLVGVVGIVLSIIGLVQINQNSATQKGKGLAIGGLLVSILAVLISIAYFIFLIKVGELNSL